MWQLWDRITAWYSANVAPEYRIQLNPGATTAQIQQVENDLAVTFPADVRESYLCHDGSNEVGIFTGGSYYLSLAGIVHECSLMKEMMADLQGHIDRGDLEYLESWDGLDLQPRGPVRPVWWTSSWIPILCLQSGHYLCADTDPDEGGTVGQFIERRTDIGPVRVLGTSFREFFAKFVSGLEAGDYKFDTVEGQVRKIRKKRRN